METQKIINVLNDSSKEESSFAAKKMVRYSETAKSKCDPKNSIKFETEYQIESL